VELYARCNRRVEEMMRRGFVEEVKRIRVDLEKNPTARHAVGYKEVLAHLRGELGTDEMVKQIQQHTRQLAKRQLTWFRREHNLKWIEIEDDGHQYTSELVSRLQRLYLDHSDSNRS
jgi:tRNA dimethylallyltransferase